MSFEKVSGLDDDVFKKEESGACCGASIEVAQVTRAFTQKCKSRYKYYVCTCDNLDNFAAERNCRPSREEDRAA